MPTPTPLPMPEPMPPVEPEDGGDRRQLSLRIDDAGATTVRKCDTYMKDVMQDDEDKLWQFEELLVIMEEDMMCAGICSGIEDEPPELYPFSNVNNGEPTETCREALKDLISDNIELF